MVKQATKPQVSKEEKKYRKDNIPDVDEAVKKNILCTTCNSSVKHSILKGKVLTHPFLETLLCEKCHEFFGDGDFSVDEDGSDKYCRWCGQGGTLYLCSTCTAGFCKRCIKRNLPRSALKEVDDDDWKCYCCVVKPLFELRATSWAAQEYAKKLAEKKGSKTNNVSDSEDESPKEKEKGKKRKMESEEESTPKKRHSERAPKKRAREDSEDDEAPSKQKKSKSEDKKSKSSKPSLSRAEKKLYKRVALKFTAVLNDASKISEKVKTKVNKCRATSRDFSNMRSIEDIKNARENISSMLSSIKKLCEDMDDVVSDSSDQIIKQLEKFHEEKKENGVSDKEEEPEKKDEVKNDESLDDENLDKTIDGDKSDEKEDKSDAEKELKSDDEKEVKSDDEKEVKSDDEKEVKSDDEKEDKVDNDKTENEQNSSGTSLDTSSKLDDSKDE